MKSRLFIACLLVLSGIFSCERSKDQDTGNYSQNDLTNEVGVQEANMEETKCKHLSDM
jgi:hypothetical protein